MITVVVPVSPIKQNPEFSILAETIGSIRHHLKDAEIFLCFDGVRPEQEARRADYEEAIRRILWTADKQWGACVPWIFDEHLHQVGMLRRVIATIETPLMLFCEQDTPLVTTELIAWPTILEFIMMGHSNSVRFSHESRLLEAHAHMHHGTEFAGLFTRTSQYSARPHVATVPFYRQLLTHFTPEAKCFVEDLAHGVIDQAYKLDGIAGWNIWRTHLYTPEGNIQRSLHLDGRAGEAKYDASQVF